jgi:AraC family transcriptional regulator
VPPRGARLRAAVMDAHRGGLPQSRLRRVAEHVEANLTRKLALAELSAVVHMSPYHFARLFHRAAGVTPRQFVIRRRIEAARLLLDDPGRPIGEVALAVGFRTGSHFTNRFRRSMGVTPSDYQRRNVGILPERTARTPRDGGSDHPR